MTSLVHETNAVQKSLTRKCEGSPCIIARMAVSGGTSMTASSKAARVAAVGISLWLGMACAVAADRAKALNIYAWSEYFPAALIAKFQTETGIHVNYAVLDSPETAETILSVGNSNYDLVTMNAAPELGREIPRGFWKVLDKGRIPNARNATAKVRPALSRTLT